MALERREGRIVVQERDAGLEAECCEEAVDLSGHRRARGPELALELGAAERQLAKASLYREAFAKAEGFELAANLLERLAETRQPVLRAS